MRDLRGCGLGRLSVTDLITACESLIELGCLNVTDLITACKSFIVGWLSIGGALGGRRRRDLRGGEAVEVGGGKHAGRGDALPPVYHIILHYIILHYIILHYIILYYIILYMYNIMDGPNKVRYTSRQ